MVRHTRSPVRGAEVQHPLPPPPRWRVPSGWTGGAICGRVARSPFGSLGEELVHVGAGVSVPGDGAVLRGGRSPVKLRSSDCSSFEEALFQKAQKDCHSGNDATYGRKDIRARINRPFCFRYANSIPGQPNCGSNQRRPNCEEDYYVSRGHHITNLTADGEQLRLHLR